MKNKKGFVDPENTASRPTGTYGDVIKKIEADGVCPFCSDHLGAYHPNPLIRKKFWWVTDNAYPYKPTKHHRLFIHIDHISHVSELSVEAWTELQGILAEETRNCDVVGGTLIMRFGETRFTGGSVSHLHAHLVQSNPDDTTYDPKNGVTMRIG